MCRNGIDEHTESELQSARGQLPHAVEADWLFFVNRNRFEPPGRSGPGSRAGASQTPDRPLLRIVEFSLGVLGDFRYCSAVSRRERGPFPVDLWRLRILTT